MLMRISKKVKTWLKQQWAGRASIAEESRHCLTLWAKDRRRAGPHAEGGFEGPRSLSDVVHHPAAVAGCKARCSSTACLHSMSQQGLGYNSKTCPHERCLSSSCGTGVCQPLLFSQAATHLDIRSHRNRMKRHCSLDPLSHNCCIYQGSFCIWEHAYRIISTSIKASPSFVELLAVSQLCLAPLFVTSPRKFSSSSFCVCDL